MKILKWFTVAVLVCSSQMATASCNGNLCDPCDPCYDNECCDICDIDFCNLTYTAYVDFLYWKVCRTDLDTEVHDGEAKFLNPCFDPAFRLGFFAHSDCWDFGLRYTRFCTDQKESLENSGEVDDAKFCFDFDVLDLETGYTCKCSCLTIRPFVGAKFAWADDHFETNEFDSKIDYCGCGIYLGAGGRLPFYSFCACDRTVPVSLVTRCSTGILDSKFKEDVDGDCDCDDSEKHCVYVPYLDAYVGLEFTFCDLCCGDAFLQIGYEAQYWGWREYDSHNDVAHLGLGGLTMRFGASF